jgi:hypothetical protein
MGPNGRSVLPLPRGMQLWESGPIWHHATTREVQQFLVGHDDTCAELVRQLVWGNVRSLRRTLSDSDGAARMLVIRR